MIRLQKSAQSLDANNLRLIVDGMFGLNDSVQRLMNAFMMIILTVLLEGIFKLPNG